MCNSNYFLLFGGCCIVDFAHLVTGETCREEGRQGPSMAHNGPELVSFSVSMLYTMYDIYIYNIHLSIHIHI